MDCTYNRPSRRRRNPSGPQTSPPNVLPSQIITSNGNANGNGRLISPASDDTKGQELIHSNIATTAGPGGPVDYTGAYVAVREGHPGDVLAVAWRSFALASLVTIDQYLEIYMDVVYPIYPLFHGPTLWERIRKRHQLVDRGFFASVMAACALAAARVRDGAIGKRYNFSETPEKSSEIFFAAAQDCVLKDLSRAQDFGYMRACALLALTAIQYGQIKTMHQYIGTYSTLSAMHHFHDESHWPQDTSVVEKEERRRLFWSMYTLDIYSSITWDSVMMSQETASNVRYPREVNDEDLQADIASPANEESWLRGWNFTTDLYRILEHSVKRMRRNKQISHDRISVTRLLIADGIPESQVMDNVLGLYYQLPARFKDYSVPVTGNKNHDFVGFQAANIQATLQLVRMTLFSTSLSHDVNQKCNVAQQVLSTFHAIAPQYLRAISTPLVYHLGGIGRILASVMEGLLCEESYQHVRSLLVSMADLLSGLESGLQPSAGASRDLRKQIDKIDAYMDAQRRLISSVSAPPQHPMSSPDDLANGLITQAQTPLVNAMGMQTPLDEFQLPPDLVNDGAWPWPFDFTQQGSPMPFIMTNGYE